MKIKPVIDFENKEFVTATDIINALIKSRNIKDKESFLNPPTLSNLSLVDFGFDKKYIDQFINLLVEVYKNGESVIVYSDYDCDGVTGGAVLWESLYLMGFKVMPYIPGRKTEGYGFSKIGIDNVYKKFNPKLIISVDHGITAKNLVSYARDLGINVVVTDHHHKQEEKVPDTANFIFHIKELSGSSVAFFVAKEIFLCLKNKISIKNIDLLRKHFEGDYVGICCIGTVADLVPLIGPSRSVVYYGLTALKQTKRVGVKALFDYCNLKKDKISTFDVGFLIAPRINAVGRLDDALDALRLLCTKNSAKASALALKVQNLNLNRQRLVDESFKEALSMVSEIEEIPSVIMLKNYNWHEGVIGLIASKLLEKFNRPVIILTGDDNILKASARSINSIHITNLLENFKDLLIAYGGHAQAAGFSIKTSNYLSLVTKINEYLLQNITKDDLEHVFYPDFRIPLNFLNLKIAEALEVLEPYGVSNLKPIFYSTFKVSQIKFIGRENKHIKFKAVSIKDSNFTIDMVFFNGKDKILMNENDLFDGLFNIDINVWNGKKQLQGLVKHLIPFGSL